VESNQKVWKSPYVLKLVKEMEGKYTETGTGRKALWPPSWSPPYWI